MTLAEPLQITQLIIRELERLSIRYQIGGSLASSLYGIPRATHDVDIVVEITIEHVPQLVKALKQEFYIDANAVLEAVQRRDLFNIIHLETMFKVDIFVMSSDDTSREEMDRRKPYHIPEVPRQPLWLTSAEDIVVRKLHWYKLGNCISERQWKDTLGILQVQKGTLDLTYLEQAARHYGVDDLLQKALHDAEYV